MGLVKIVNVSSLSVAIPDILVHLPGRGSEEVVSSEVIASSKDLSSVRGLVRLVPVVTEKKMPVWPFHKPMAQVAAPVARPPVPASVPDPSHDTVPTTPTPVDPLLSEIRDLLKVLVHQGASAPAHAADRIRGVTNDVRIMDDVPMFIPESIMPKDAESKINLNSSDVQKPDFESAKNALSKARKR